MNRKQWYVFGIGFILLGFLLTGISSLAAYFCVGSGNSDLTPCVKQHAFAPFPYILFGIGTMCFICSGLEEGKKK